MFFSCVKRRVLCCKAPGCNNTIREQKRDRKLDILSDSCVLSFSFTDRISCAGSFKTILSPKINETFDILYNLWVICFLVTSKYHKQCSYDDNQLTSAHIQKKQTFFSSAPVLHHALRTVLVFMLPYICSFILWPCCW